MTTDEYKDIYDIQNESSVRKPISEYERKVIKRIELLKQNQEKITANKIGLEKHKDYLDSYGIFLDSAEENIKKRLMNPAERNAESSEFLSGMLRGIMLAKEKLLADRNLATDLDTLILAEETERKES